MRTLYVYIQALLFLLIDINFFQEQSIINYKNKLTSKVLIKDKCELGRTYG